MRATSPRNLLIVALGVALCVGTGWATRLPSSAAGTAEASAPGRFGFAVTDVNGDPAGGRIERPVQPSLQHIRAWISAVGAAAGLADLDGDGLSGEACLVDPRDDSVTIRALPAARFPVFPLALPPSPGLTVAPMGCVPADLNEDGHTDVLVHFWGRTPLLYLRLPGVALGTAAFRAVEVAPDPAEIWNSTTANVLDLDGDGGLDLFVGNYFPDEARVLDATVRDDPHMRMQDSMSNAANGGTNRILRLAGIDAGGGGIAVPRYTDASAALTGRQSRGWTLATGAQDLNDDGLPEIYVANDFGPDQLLLNRSAPGRIAFGELRGVRTASMPKSKVLGDDSFKSMGVAYTDLNRDSRPDMVVSNITTSRGLEESNFAFVRTSDRISGGRAPFADQSERLGLARTGWAWDVKAADFDADGTDEIVQALGFLKGRVDRWAQLQELAMANDDLLRFPYAWPEFGPGDDVAGHQRDKFLVQGGNGRYFDVAADVGVDNPGPSRGIAIGDTDHDGRVDMLVANQWARSQYLHNTATPRPFLGLRLLLPGVNGGQPRPAIGAAVTVTRADGIKLRAQLYPANGHTGVNAPELHFGLGASEAAPVTVTVTRRDGGGMHTTTRSLRPGWHDLVLD